MSVELLWITPDAENVLLYCARVSSDQGNQDPGLLRYLIRNKHWSPFEMASASFEIRTSRTIAHQILRHRSFSFQEFSQRYASPDRILLYDARRQAETNRQSSTTDVDPELQAWWHAVQFRLHDLVREYYDKAIAAGIARECARFILPEATETTIIMTGTLRSWIHYFDLRCDEHTQLEHQLLALTMRDVLTHHLPTLAVACGWDEEDQPC